MVFNRLNKTEKYAIVLLLVAFGIVYPFLDIPWHRWTRDDCYQALSCRDYVRQPIAMLSFYIGHLWTSLFSDSLLSLRRLMAVSYILSIGAGCLWFYRHTRAALAAAAWFAALMVMVPACSLFLFGWDVAAYPFTVLALLAALRFLHAPDVRSSIFLGASLALLTLARVPAGVSAICALILIKWLAPKNPHPSSLVPRPSSLAPHPRSLVPRPSSLAPLAFLLTASILILLMGGFSQYFHAWAPDNIINNHYSIRPYLARILTLSPYILTAYGCGAAALLFSMLFFRIRKGRGSSLAKAAVLFGGFAVPLCLALMVPWTVSAVFGIPQFILLALLFYLPFYNLTHDSRRPVSWTFLLTVIAFALVPAVGSDGMVERPLCLPLIPVAAVAVWRYRPRALWLTVGILALCAVAVRGQEYLERLKEEGEISMRSIPSPHFAGVHTLDSTWLEVSDMVVEARADGSSVAFAGTPDRFIPMYAFSDTCPASLQLFDFDADSPSQLDLVLSDIGNADKVFIFRDNAKPEDIYAPLINALSSRSYTLSATRSFPNFTLTVFSR